MNSEIIELSATQREIKLEVPASDVVVVFNKICQKYARGAVVPGFRKGYAPVDVIKMRYREEIRSEVLQELLPGKVADAIKHHEVQPLGEPQILQDGEEEIVVNGTKPLRVSIQVEVMPELPKVKYKGYELTRRTRPVEDSEIEHHIEHRLKQHAAFVPVDRKSKKGDTVICDLEGKIEGDDAAEPIKVDGLEIEIGGENIEKSFTDNLAGVKADDEKDFSVTYGDDFQSPQLAGKTVNYHAKITSVGVVESPKLDDAWVKSLDEDVKTVAALKKKMREDLERMAKADAEARLGNDAMAKLIADHEFEVPNIFVENQSRNLLNNFAQDMQQRGADLSKVGKDFIETLYSQMRTQAERDVRGAMLLEKVIESEKVEVTEDDFQKELEQLAGQYQIGVEDFKNRVGAEGIENMRSNLRTRKAVEAIVKQAKVKDGEWVDPNAAPAVEAEEKPKKKSAKAAKPAEEKEEKAEKKPAAKKTTKAKAKE